MGFYRKKLITFFINEVCNMKCIYCTIHSDNAEKKESPKVIDLDFAKCGIDDYFSNGFFKDDEKKGIRFFANGEPTLEFSLVKEITKYALAKSNNDLFVEMQSNGYFPEEVAQWISENVDMLWISLDGVGEVQDNQRLHVDGMKSFDLIDKNIKIINQSKKTQIGLRPTISTYNLNKQKELIDYAVESGIVMICADPWANLMGKLEGQPDLIEFANSYLEALNYAKSKRIYYDTEFSVNFDEEVEVYCRSCLATPQFTPDGHVSSCDMVNTKDGFLPKYFPELIFGEYDKEKGKIIYNQKHIDKIKSRNIHNLHDCQSCEALKHCAGGCIGIAIASSLDFYGIHKEYCTVTKYLYKKLKSEINRGYDYKIPIHP